MSTFWWFLIAFLAGSLPFSVWIGRVVLRRDIRAYGDANPGATNVLRAGGKGAFVLASLLDSFKAAIPVGLAYRWAGLDGGALALVAAAPLLGHAFSPFLRFQGGKAVATTFGSWAGLTLWEGPTLFGLGLLLATRIMRANGWAVLSGMVFMLLGLLLAPASWGPLAGRPAPATMILAWALHIVILIYTHRADLAHPPARRTPSGTGTP